MQSLFAIALVALIAALVVTLEVGGFSYAVRLIAGGPQTARDRRVALAFWAGIALLGAAIWIASEFLRQ